MMKAYFCAASVAMVLNAVSPAAAFTDPEKSDIAPYTALSGAPMDAIKQAMETPYLALSLTVDPEKKAISGLARYTVRALSPLDAVEFDLDPRFDISSVEIGGKEVPKGRWQNDGGKLNIRLESQLAQGGSVEVSIRYSGQPRVAPNAPWDGGFVWAKTPEGKDWVATAVQGTGCDLFWPCLDHPTKRVGVLDMAIKVPEGLVAASNGKLLGVDRAGGWTTYRWRAKTPNDYGVSLQIGPYDLAEAEYHSRFGNSFPIQFWYLPGHKDGADRLVAEMQDYLDFFESTIGPYPFGDEKVGIAETPHKGMEHQTINAYGNAFVLAPEGYDELMQHEFSHEYFANQLTGARVADLWLHEGLGSYMQPLYLEWKDGTLAYDAKMWDLRKRIYAKLPVSPDEEVASTLYDDKVAGWGRDIYFKGAWIAHSLRYLIGDEAFFRALRRLTYGRPDPAPGNFAPVTRSTADFERIAEQESGRDLGWFFDAYLRNAALPVLTAERDGTTLSLSWQSAAAEPFAMPVVLEIGGERMLVAMDGGRASVELPAADTHFVLDPNGSILREDPAVTAWRKQEEEAEAQKATANQ